MMRNRSIGDNAILRQAQDLLRGRLPAEWAVTAQPCDRVAGAGACDSTIEVRAPDGRSATLAMGAHKRLDPKDVQTTVAGVLQRCGVPATAFFAAPYLGERSRQKLRGLGAGYVDLTGNIYLRLDEPAVLIECSGAARDPWRSERPARSLKGAKAARLVRALVDYRPPRGTRELAQIAGIDAGYASRLLALLEREDLVGRVPRGPVERIDWAELLRAWARDYSLVSSNVVYSYLQPRGLPAFLEGLRGLASRQPGTAGVPGAASEEVRYALTGSLAAARRSPVAPARLGVVFVDAAATLAEILELAPADAGANLLLVEPFDGIVFGRTSLDDGLTYVAPSQAVADLLTGPGRMPEEGEALLSWMQAHEEEWRAD